MSEMAQRAHRDKDFREQAEGIATLAQAIADGAVKGPVYAAVARLVDQVNTLKAWTEDDRSSH